MRPIACRGPVAALILASLAISGCKSSGRFADKTHSAAEDGGGVEDSATPPPPDAPHDAPDADEPTVADQPCLPVVASDALHPRAAVMNAHAVESAPTVFTQDLFNLFKSHCGGCHVDQGLGGMQVTLQNFPEKITAKALMRIRSDDPKFFMPPTGVPFSDRTPSDPVVELAGLLEAWLAAGSPADVFYPPLSSSTHSAGTPYALSPDVAMQMTNLGSCVPDRAIISRDKDPMDELDHMFEQATELPKELSDTDLTTFDSEELARHGVIAFAPAYTLWADNAKKIRLVRVPRGQSIKFDKKTQRFTIPPNTRFYKTFLKHVIDDKGNESYRKIETRLIVSRPDEKLPDGTTVVRSLFGTYAWNESETSAELVQDPLRNGTPFRDRLVTVVTNEKVAEEILRTGPDDLQAALQDAGVTRTYAIPGSERCRQCHMGSVDGSFVLGFTPLEIHRRPMGEGGVIEPAGRDELNQLQRFIDYGLIDGMASPDDVVLLEDSQGKRKPRNEYELQAQGYMMGNCVHCHNPRGFPTSIAPELRDVLDFYPSEHGGIFQFPLERFSPRIFRGENRDVPIPYITPSLYDRVGDPSAVKSVVRVEVDENGNPYTQPLLAPWRSLIYRNTDTPFPYADNSAIFPHMPMNTPGYDCRTRQIFGTWMVSIPARWKQEEVLVDRFREVAEDQEPQPYEEVMPDDPDYRRYARYASVRLDSWQKSVRYTDCPEPALDIVDPAVIAGSRIVPDSTYHDVLDADGKKVGYVAIVVPARPHWAVTDLTNPPGDWNPRRADWNDVLVERKNENESAKLALELLDSANIHITDEVRDFALTDRPFGLWLDKDGCDFGDLPKVADLAGPTEPAWVDVVKPDDDRTVYSISPGAQVFTAICANCHGPLADSAGRLAATIADMTGGQTRVADLRDGILGPVDDPGANRARVFGVAANADMTADDWAARYVLWMGLGGTQRVIPKAALTVVGSTTVLGESRTGLGGFTATTANMLTAARFLCSEVLPETLKAFDVEHGAVDHRNEKYRSALITKNGDAEMWQALCTFGNPAPVRMLTAELSAGSVQSFRIVPVADYLSGQYAYPLFFADSYPVDQLVGDQTGNVTMGIQPGNTDPWCIERPQGTSAPVDAYWSDVLGRATPVPYCPETGLQRFTKDDVDRWTARGAMNAGLSVFLYLDALAKGEKESVIPYDRCEELKASTK